jgi:hypothetical protein
MIPNPPEDAYFKSRRICFVAIIYNQFTEEMTFYDFEGNILSQGDCSLEFPKGVKRFLY